VTIHLDIGISQLKKAGEELCGDSIEIQNTKEFDIIVLSDGLGSGVKANILSQLTAKTAITMLQKGSEVDEVIETLAHTLPVCRVRKLAYSTFTIVQVFPDGKVYLAEYDNPDVFWGHRGKICSPPGRERVIDNKVIKESFFTVTDGDWLVLSTDGILHAGIGGIWNMGWGKERLSRFLEQSSFKGKTASDWAAEITRFCNHLYGGKPGDDASVVVLKIRNPRCLTLLIGPPAQKEYDSTVVDKLIKSPGQKVVCGGTTGNIVGRHLNKEVAVDLKSNNEKVPPMGIIPGIDLVTEGTLTLVYTLEILRANPNPVHLASKNDGASKLAAKLLEADSIHFIIGTAENPAQKSPEAPTIFAYKQQIIEELIQVVQGKNKKIRVEYY